MELPDRAEDRSEYMQEHVYFTNQAPAGPRIFYENPAIIRRLRRHLLPEEEGSGSSSCSSGDTNVNPVTLTSYSSPKAIPSPLNPLNLLNPLNPSRSAAPMAIPQPSQPQAASILRTLRTFGPKARQPSRRRRVIPGAHTHRRVSFRLLRLPRRRPGLPGGSRGGR